MPAYVMVDVNITDPARYEDYKKLTPDIVGSYGRKFIVCGGTTEVLEGDGRPGRVVVLEFPDMEKAKAWYDSPEYTEAKKIGFESSSGKMMLVEGF